MNGQMQGEDRLVTILRPIGWGTAAMLLLAPLVAMQFTSEVDWDETDFIVMGAMLALAGGLMELAVWLSRNWWYRIGFVLAVLGGFLTLWSNLAVGIVGNEDNPFNMWFFAIPLLGMVGATIARGIATGMMATMLLMAGAQVALFVAALVTDAGGDPRPALFFLPFWLASAALFGIAAREARR